MPEVHLRRVALKSALCALSLNSGGGLVKSGLPDPDWMRTEGKRRLAEAVLVLVHSRKRESAESMPEVHLRRVALKSALCALSLSSGGGLVKSGLPDPDWMRTEGKSAGFVAGR